MSYLFDILLRFRVKGKWAGDLYMWWWRRGLRKAIDSIEISADDISFKRAENVKQVYETIINNKPDKV